MIIIENLCKAYNDKILFKNFHLEIPDSSFLVISGESGCGKSTLLNMIGGIETPDKGSIIVNGFDVAKKGKKQKPRRRKQERHRKPIARERKNMQLP